MRIVVAIAIALLSVGVLALAWRLQLEADVRDQITAQIQDLQRQLAEKSRREIFELQKECASQAEKVFRQEGFKLGLHTEVIG